MRDKKTSVFMCVRVLIGVVIALFSASTSTAQCIDYDDYMHWVGTVETPGTISKMVVSGSYSYAVDSEAGLQIFDLTSRKVRFSLVPWILPAYRRPSPYQGSMFILGLTALAYTIFSSSM